MTRPFPPARIRIGRLALAKLLVYADGCPVEIGGLGYVVWQGEDLVISDLFILRQRVSVSDTELEPEALFAFLDRVAGTGGDVAGVRLWWHSHGDMELLWSETDCATIENLPGDFWVAVLVNRKGEVRCRLDAYAPARQTWELPLEVMPEGDEVDAEALRAGIEQEILDQVQMCRVDQGEDTRGEAVEAGGEPRSPLGAEAVAAGGEPEQLHRGK